MQKRNTKWIATLVAGALIVSVIVVGTTYWLKRRSGGKAPAAPRLLPSDVNQEASGYTFTRSEGGREIFSVHAGRTVAYKRGGRTVLEDVSVEVFGRTGTRRDVLRTERCQYDRESGSLACAGKVEIELNSQAGRDAGGAKAAGKISGGQPIYVETSEVSFDPQSSIAVSRMPVRFHYGPASGSAVGLAYATKEGWLELKKEVVVNLPLPGASGAQPLQAMAPRPRTGVTTTAAAQPVLALAARSLRYTKESGQVELRGPVEITEGSRRVTSETGTIELDDRNRVASAALEGNVRAVDSTAGAVLKASAQSVRADFDPPSQTLRSLVATGDVRAESRRGDHGGVSLLSAQQLQVNFSGARFHPHDGTATENVRLSLESTATSAPRQGGTDGVSLRAGSATLTASQLRFTFSGDGSSLRDAHTVGAGKLVLVPPDPKAGQRLVTAGQFLMDFDARGRLTGLQGTSPTQIVFEPAQNAPPSSMPLESSADRLEAAFNAATGALETLIQAGHLRFRSGDRQGTADQAQYSQNETVTLTGQPLFWEPETRIRANRVQIDLGTDTVEGVGRVQSTHFAGKNPAVPAASGSQPWPGNGEPRGQGTGPTEGGTTNVLADLVLVDRRKEFAHYEGHVRAWHGYDVIESPALDVYRKEHRISSERGVVMSDLEPAPAKPDGTSGKVGTLPAKNGAGATQPVTIRADRVQYFDLDRKASFTGHVQLQSDDAELGADRLDVYFSGNTRTEATQVERAVADGHVRVLQPGRRATGEHAEYFAATGKLVMNGGPPAVYDAENGFATGQRLTLFVQDDTLALDGGVESPTLSKLRLAH